MKLFKTRSTIAYARVYDFRRRNKQLFENYRAVAYELPAEYDYYDLRKEILKDVKDLLEAGAMDDGTANCLIYKITDSVKRAFNDLDRQAIAHSDFYHRQEDNMHAHVNDIGKMIELLKTEMESIESEYKEFTYPKWDSYRKGGASNEAK